MRRSIVITKATTPAVVDNGSVGLTGVAGALSAGSVAVSGAAWNLPATISVQQDGTVGLRQYALNAGAHTISVSGLPTGVTYNAGLEQLEGASTGTASATVTFTLALGAITVVATATVALIDVSSTLVHGELFTITGSGFGTKPAQSPLFYWNGQGTASFSGQIADSYGFADSGLRGVASPHSRIPRYWWGLMSNDVIFPYSIAVECAFSAASYPTAVFASFYRRFDPNWQSFSGDRQYKPWTHQASGSGYGGAYSYVGYEGVNTAGGNLISQYRTESGKYSFGSVWAESAVNPTKGWTRAELVLNVDTSAGFLKCFETTTLAGIGAREVLSTPTGNTTLGQSVPTSSRIMFGGYVRDASPSNYGYYTDVFLDYGQNRVVLSNSPTLLGSGSLYHEPQPYTAWSDTSITITANCGAIPNGSTAYLHVIGPDGNAAISPIQVTVGG